MHVLQDLDFDLVLGQTWWWKHMMSFDLRHKNCLSPSPFRLSLVTAPSGALVGNHALNTVAYSPRFDLPEEFSDFAPLFETGTTIPTPVGNEHVFSFKFKELKNFLEAAWCIAPI